jgi:subtilase family serine protease
MRWFRCGIGNRILTGLTSCFFLVTASQQTLDSAPKPQTVANRLTGEISASRHVTLKDNQPPPAHAEDDAGEVSGSLPMQQMALVLKMTGAQQAALNQLLSEQQTRSSSNYHKWLTPEEYADRFGVSQNDAQKIRAWLEREGFSSVEVARSRSHVYFDGTADLVKAAFLTSIHHYQKDGVTHYANSSAPFVPSELDGMVAEIRGLNDFHPKARAVRSRKAGDVNAAPHFTSSISGSHFIAPQDFAIIYNVTSLYNAGIDGTGQKIAIAGQTDIATSDIDAFRAAAGLPAHDPQVVLYGTDPGTSTSDLGEADLDIEWAGAVARNATIVYVNSTDVFNSAIHTIDDNLAPVLSITYGSCEANMSASEVNTFTTAFQQANSQGITVIAASGDFGATDCDEPANSKQIVTSAAKGLAIDVPSDIPFVTAMGGTEFSEGTATYWNATNNSSNGSVISYIPEAAWNDTSATNGIAATGGGVSLLFTKPAWQTGENVPNDGFRDTPDVSLAASPDHDGFLMCSGGDCVTGFRNTDTTLDVVGGTSVGAPSFAGIIALLNQHTGTIQGNINLILYPLAAATTNVFHDITTGGNKVPCTLGSTDCPTGGTIGYSAGVGYDQATGLGTVDAANLVNEWTTVSANTGNTISPDFTFTLSPASLTLTRGTPATTTASVSPLNAFFGTVTFTCQVPNSLSNTTCAVNSSVVGSGSAIVTLTAAVQSGILRLPGFRVDGNFMAWAIVFAALLLAAYVVSSKRSLRRFGRMSLAGVLAFGAIALVGCGNGDSSSSSEQNGTVTLIAASGATQHTSTISVTIN